MVLLTLLSIVQALALELLWAHINERTDLYVSGTAAIVGWLQVIVVLTGLILIWLIYAATVMRFRWIPSVSDSVWPFLIGMMEFVLVGTMGVDNLAEWFFVMALLFGVLTGVIHSIMRRARRDADNDEFFAAFEPASLQSFYPNIAVVSGFCLLGTYFWWSDNEGWIAFMALLATLGAQLYQGLMLARFWAISMGEDTTPS